MPSPFEIASSVEPLGPTTFRARVPEGWQQGRGAFGGLVLGTLLRAMERCEPERDRVVRTLMGEIVGPLGVGDAEVRVVVVRRGANQTNLRAEIVQSGAVVAGAMCVMSKARASMLGDVRPRIARPPAFASLERASPGPGAPVFTSHFDYRPLAGSRLFDAAPEPVASGWLREAQAPSAVDAPMLVALLDAWWPASLVTLSEPRRPATTIAFTAQIVVDAAKLDPALPLFHSARTITEHEGFQLEMRALHDADGAVVALNQQTFAVLG